MSLKVIEGKQSVPFVLKKELVAYFDVDDTLVMWKFPQGTAGTIQLTHEGVTREVLPHFLHIEELKNHRVRGHGVVVWSQGGTEWAARMVEQLGIKAYVDVILPKPTWAWDDKRPEHFIDRLFYIKPEALWTQQPSLLQQL